MVKFTHKPQNPAIYWAQPQQPPYQPLRSSLHWAHGGLFLAILILGLYENVIRIIWGHFEMWPRTTSKRPWRSNLKNWCVFWPQKEAMTMEWNGIGHSSYIDIILAWKIKQAFLHWIIKNIASFRYEAVEAVQGRQPKNWLSMHKSPLHRIPKMNGFCLECNFVLKKCWFELWQIVFKHPVCRSNSIKWHFFFKL